MFYWWADFCKIKYVAIATHYSAMYIIIISNTKIYGQTLLNVEQWLVTKTKQEALTMVDSSFCLPLLCRTVMWLNTSIETRIPLMMVVKWLPSTTAHFTRTNLSFKHSKADPKYKGTTKNNYFIKNAPITWLPCLAGL